MNIWNCLSSQMSWKIESFKNADLSCYYWFALGIILLMWTNVWVRFSSLFMSILVGNRQKKNLVFELLTCFSSLFVFDYHDKLFPSDILTNKSPVKTHLEIFPATRYRPISKRVSPETVRAKWSQFWSVL